MKCTLKNRPYPDDYVEINDYLIAEDKWFEGFQKELEQELENQRNFFKGKGSSYLLAVDVLAQILGGQ